jgi:hypothetical protein
MWFSRSSYALIKAARFYGFSLRDTAFGLRCSMRSRCSSATSPDLIRDAAFFLDPVF